MRPHPAEGLEFHEHKSFRQIEKRLFEFSTESTVKNTTTLSRRRTGRDKGTSTFARSDNAFTGMRPLLSLRLIRPLLLGAIFLWLAGRAMAADDATTGGGKPAVPPPAPSLEIGHPFARNYT